MQPQEECRPVPVESDSIRACICTTDLCTGIGKEEAFPATQDQVETFSELYDEVEEVFQPEGREEIFEQNGSLEDESRFQTEFLLNVPLPTEPQRSEPQINGPQRSDPQRSDPQTSDPQRRDPPRRDPQRSDPPRRGGAGDRPNSPRRVEDRPVSVNRVVEEEEVVRSDPNRVRCHQCGSLFGGPASNPECTDFQPGDPQQVPHSSHPLSLTLLFPPLLPLFATNMTRLLLAAATCVLVGSKFDI